MNLVDYLVEQCRNPNGFVGNIMLKTMAIAHKSMMYWGLCKIEIECNSNILDIGCGNGKLIKILSSIQNTETIYGVDYSDKAVSSAIKNNRSDVNNGKIIIKESDVLNLPFQDNCFNIVTAFQTHYFWHDLEKSISEIYRVLKINGKLLITSEKYKITYHMTKYNTNDSMKDLLIKCGFQSIDIFESDKVISFAAIK